MIQERHGWNGTENIYYTCQSIHLRTIVVSAMRREHDLPRQSSTVIVHAHPGMLPSVAQQVWLFPTSWNQGSRTLRVRAEVAYKLAYVVKELIRKGSKCDDFGAGQIMQGMCV